MKKLDRTWGFEVFTKYTNHHASMSNFLGSTIEFKKKGLRHHFYERGSQRLTIDTNN